jgi:poly-gamma-glutamate capsule biosynthesis protein CapA/YwtB (metallophosphatase superfamily)
MSPAPVSWNRREFVGAAGMAALGAALPGGLEANEPKPSPDASGTLRLMALGQALIAHDRRKRPDSGFQKLAGFLRESDVCFTNLEVALRGEGAGKRTKDGIYFHAADPDVLDCLQEWSVNLLALSNNHSWDLGDGGILAAIREARRRDIPHAGTGSNLEEAAAPGWLRTDRGTVALVSMASRVRRESIAGPDKPGVNHLAVSGGQPDREDMRRNLKAIEQAARSADCVLVYQHNHYWEKNWRETPGWQRDWARTCIDAGATLFVNHGVPLLHGFEIYKRRPIFYCLGNFVFDTRTPPGHYPRAVWQSVIADCRFRNGELARLELRPVALTEGDPKTDFLETRGTPFLLDDSTDRGGYESDMILRNLGQISQAYGTELRIEDGLGVAVIPNL